MFKEEATSDTPMFLIDTEKNRIEIKGVSMPENSFEFFDPLEKKALDTFKDHKGDLALEVELNYINSMSSKQLLKLVKLLSSYHPTIKVTWKFRKDDTIIKMKGEDIKKLCPNVVVDLIELPD
jgi:hypothetical protein